MGQCCSTQGGNDSIQRQNTNGSRRLSLTNQPQPVPDLPPNVNQDGIMGVGEYEMEFSCVSVAGTYFHPSINPFKGNTKYKTNQDSFFIVEEFDGPATQYMGVLDGHGSTGHHVSQFITKHLPQIVHKKLGKVDEDAEKAFIEAFAEVDHQLAENVDATLSGSTCTTCLVRNGELIVANCGDSRCVLGYLDQADEWKAKDLSDDHKPDLPNEKKRIEQTGGRVAPLESWPDGPHRVWLRHEDVPGLAMSRSLGDRLAHSVGVSSEPEVELLIACLRSMSCSHFVLKMFIELLLLHFPRIFSSNATR
eukprot:c7657_g1_i1.p1 GENE.c7657_g1_i1~~c7657_g1_i1.p1  ORF type:complete len:315 (-),score=46.44 c7657_g1_i1:480-1397(-)